MATDKCAGFFSNMISMKRLHHSFPYGIKCPQMSRPKLGKSSAQSSTLSWRSPEWWQSQRLCDYCIRTTLFIPPFLPGEWRGTIDTCGAATLSRFQLKSSSKLTGELELSNKIRPEPRVLVFMIRERGSHLCTHLILLTMILGHRIIISIL